MRGRRCFRRGDRHGRKALKLLVVILAGVVVGFAGYAALMAMGI
jgi:hypothetical protein